MQVKFSSRGTTIIAGIIGELDHHSAEYIRQKIDSELVKSSTKNIIFDFSKVTFMDSSGIGVIIGRFKNVQKMGGRVAIVGVGAQVMKLIEMSGLLKIIPVFDNIDGALSMMLEGESKNAANK